MCENIFGFDTTAGQIVDDAVCWCCWQLVTQVRQWRH